MPQPEPISDKRHSKGISLIWYSSLYKNNQKRQWHCCYSWLKILKVFCLLFFKLIRILCAPCALFVCMSLRLEDHFFYKSTPITLSESIWCSISLLSYAKKKTQKNIYIIHIYMTMRYVCTQSLLYSVHVHTLYIATHISHIMDLSVKRIDGTKITYCDVLIFPCCMPSLLLLLSNMHNFLNVIMWLIMWQWPHLLISHIKKRCWFFLPNFYPAKIRICHPFRHHMVRENCKRHHKKR